MLEAVAAIAPHPPPWRAELREAARPGNRRNRAITIPARACPS